MYRSTIVCGVIYYVFLGNNVLAQWVIEDEGCRTPDRGVGNCISVRDCAPMKTLLQNLKRPVPASVSRQIQAYTCGSQDGAVKVCCPQGPIVLNQLQTINRNEPPDVSNHPNLDLLPGFQECGAIDNKHRIVNGKDAGLREFPWMALLQYRTRRGLGFNCGGTIINDRYILTAAHCITQLKNSQLLQVRVGEYDLRNDTDCVTENNTLKCNPPIQDLRIEEVIPHPEFNTGDSFSNDIGLLRVNRIRLNRENVQPICLPLGKKRNKIYNKVLVAGWGVVDTSTGRTSDVLQFVSLPVADRATCNATYRNHNIGLTYKQICAGATTDNKDSCPGDSGGPMMGADVNDDFSAIYIQQGIVSFGPRFCGLPGYPGVYTLVAHYMDWILDNIKP
ncbi:melanization protease 1-like [Anthonomus grandis grandis]|uniref:melanization protease 1-like n=1 Tax=Anthonomus grandis grandis TaxID=2921223 RepID=UPI002166845F|nr:melanization protease 1-like [Anthonomus grandis grandis]